MYSPPSLRDHLLSSLSALPNSSRLHLVSLTSTPKRTTSLYPHTTLPPKCFQVDYFVVLGTEVDVPPTPTSDPALHPAPAEKEAAHTDPSAASTAPAPPAPSPSTTPSAPERQLVLASAISAHLYILPHSQSSILYISKIDSSSYPSHTPTSTPLPLTRTLVSSFISYFLLSSSRPTPSVRVQLFARSQGQYLFPNSEKGKKGLGGAKLCGWWKGVYEDVARAVVAPPSGVGAEVNPTGSADSAQAGETSLPKIDNPSADDDKIPPSRFHLAYLLPSFSALEAQGVLGAPRQPLPAGVEWKYEPPFSTPIRKIGRKPYDGHGEWAYKEGFSLADLIPSLEDDPKTRFLEEVATGEHGDYPADGRGALKAEKGKGDPDGQEGEPSQEAGDATPAQDGAAATSDGGPAPESSPSPGSTPKAQRSVRFASSPDVFRVSRSSRSVAALEDEAYRHGAHRALQHVTPSEFWERMGFRGECASDVTGFFSMGVSTPNWALVLSALPLPGDPELVSHSTEIREAMVSPDPKPARGQLAPGIVERIQKALMNTDFSTLDWALQGSGDWMASTRQIILGEVGPEALEGWCEGTVEAKSAEEVAGKAGKREREQEVVTVLKPRKKKKA